MTPTIAYDGKIIRVEQIIKPDGRILEKAVRPPGTRVIIYDPSVDKILLNQEVRLDIGKDIRLPGGKIRETNKDWDQVKNNPQKEAIIIEAATKEVREEAGLEVSDLKIFTISTSGGPTVEFTLYYLVTQKFSVIGHQDLTEDEIITNIWVPVKEVIDMCLTGKIQEGRSVAALLQYLHSINKI